MQQEKMVNDGSVKSPQHPPPPIHSFGSLNGRYHGGDDFHLDEQVSTVDSKEDGKSSSNSSHRTSSPNCSGGSHTSDQSSSYRYTNGHATVASKSTVPTMQPSLSQQEAIDNSDCYVIACDYVRQRLERANYQWHDCPTLPEANRVRLAMRILGEEFERRYNVELNEMIEQLNVTEATAYPTFLQVAQGLFQDGVNWGRIVALHSFGGALAAQCVQNGRTNLVQSVADWVAVFVEAQLDHWIRRNGGWEGFVAFYEQGQTATPGGWDWNRLMTGIGAVAAAGAVGAVALGKMLAR